MTSILAKNTLYITHIICTETILDKQKATTSVDMLLASAFRKKIFPSF